LTASTEDGCDALVDLWVAEVALTDDCMSLRCEGAFPLASRSLIMSVDVRMSVRDSPGTGTGPRAVWEPPFCARPLPDGAAVGPPPAKSDIEAFSREGHA